MTRERQRVLDEFESNPITMLAPADHRAGGQIGSYPHTIDNGGGERLTFHALRRDERGERYFEVSNVVAPGAGPPMHVHHFEEESLTVVRGTMGYQRKGGPVQNARAGETVTFGPGDAHRFWNACDDDLICKGVIRWPGSIEYFLTEIFASTKRQGGKRPGVFDAAYLSHRYRTEFEMLEAPKPVRRLMFPLIAAVGSLLGKHRRFAGAPEPVR
jgi:quercetin dioxygenase-like cupin family protein